MQRVSYVILDSLAKLFVEAKQNPSDRKVILRQAEDAWDQVSLASDRKSAEVYVKVCSVTGKSDELKSIINS